MSDGADLFRDTQDVSEPLKREEAIFEIVNQLNRGYPK
jgi:hypothetical protein